MGACLTKNRANSSPPKDAGPPPQQPLGVAQLRKLEAANNIQKVDNEILVVQKRTMT
jgi:hypothetical protein